MTKLTLYGAVCSPPVRACLLTLKALNLQFEFKVVNLFAGEQHTAAYIALNPTRTVPTLVDDGHCITDSHAIIAYLASQYGKDDSLYPKDLLQRAIVDQRLYYENAVVFYNGLLSITKELLFENQTQVPQKKIDNIISVYETLEIYLHHDNYMAGNALTIADFSLLPTVTSLSTYLHIDAVKYPKLTQWLQRLENLPYYEETNGQGARLFVEMVQNKGFTIVP